MKISQEIYIREFLDQRGLLGTTGVDTPAIETGPDSNMTEEDLPQTDEEKDELKKLPFQEDIGCLYWMASISRPDIYYAVHRASKWQTKPSKKLWRWLERIKRYLINTQHIGLVYTRENVVSPFSAYCDASFATEFGAKSGFFF